MWRANETCIVDFKFDKFRKTRERETERRKKFSMSCISFVRVTYICTTNELSTDVFLRVAMCYVDVPVGIVCSSVTHRMASLRWKRN